MPKLEALNSDHPPELFCPGAAAGAGLDLDLSTFSDHVSSRAATISRCGRKTRSASVLAIKAVFAPDVRPPHDIRNEARIMASLDHPNICPLLNAYYVDSHFILALPFYPFTLRTLLDNPSFRPEINGSEPQDESDSFEVVSKAIIAQMCAAVAYLEEEGIAHRDISPSNWLLDTSGRAVLTDFGTVWLAGSAEGAHQAPLDFELGTGGYRAPELLFGSRSYDPVCIDRWALGCCIAEFFTPFAADEAGMDSDEDSDNIDSGIASPWDAIGRESRGPKSSAGNAPPRPAWMGPAASARRPKPLHKAALFDGGWSDFALIGSIFKTLGTPNLETWPEAASLPDFGKFSFKAFPPRLLTEPSILPNLPPSERESTSDFVQRFLVYPYRQRSAAREALRHPYMLPDKAVPTRMAPLSPDSTNEQEKGALRKHLAHWL